MFGIGIMIRTVRYSKKHGMTATIKKAAGILGAPFRYFFLREDFLRDAHRAVDRCRPRDGRYHRLHALCNVAWNLLSLVRFYKSDRKRVKIDVYKAYGLSKPDPAKMNVGILMNGGLGDYVVAANYIWHFFRKYGNGSVPCSIDVFCEYAEKALDILFDGSFTNRAVAIKHSELYGNGIDRRYDLFIDMGRYPVVRHRNMGRINSLMPELVEYILLIERFEMKHPGLRHSPVMDAKANALCVLNCMLRIQQPDIDGFLGVGKSFDFSLLVSDMSEEYLAELGLKDKKFVAVVNDSDPRYGGVDNNKCWLTPYYEILLRRLKESFPEWVFVRIGGMNDIADGCFDLDLAAKTSLDEAKIILKHAHLLISSEGGLVHLRAAVHGGCSVVLFGPTDPAFYGYEGNINLRGDGCPCACEGIITKEWSRQCLNAHKKLCMRSLTPNTVYDAIMRYEEEECAKA